MVGFLWCLVVLAKFGSARQAFYVGLLTGMLIYPVQAFFFYTIFDAAAVVFWLILSFYVALFLLLARSCFAAFNPVTAALLVPFLWTGLEYFRSELNYLRFSWVNVGFAFSGGRVLPFQLLGIYGVGFLMALAATVLMTVRRKKLAAGIVLGVFAVLALLQPAPSGSGPAKSQVHVAGVQLEAALDHQIVPLLNQLKKKFPATDLFVLSEYTFDGPVPDAVRAWCREHRRHLLAGGKEPAANGNYTNTAFVIGPDGEVAFKQGKSVPVQFMKDGVPAREQQVWASPWGKIGIGICYDLSYARVTDRLIRRGAQALIVPTGDLSEWGRQQHELHSRVGPVRAAEHGVPIFRLSPTGVSQVVDRAGRVQASAPFPGELATIAGVLELRQPGTLPLDRWLAPFSVFVTALVTCCLLAVSIRNRRPLKGAAAR